ncbi:hypothetical protein BDV40DRAFT_305358 [Aspergillus tamarii]|uniref:Amine oxidase domain-containing protein n=1 Tax=Aspergillus tamarii TaxID=41984 RepID=A0A5N6UFF2_ASPTM|nr:hypothetical protein BDV40DRAFT_305358 [Aspergillus tamarii]
MTRYIDLLDRYPYLDLGFHLPNPLPEDLLLPFGGFLDKFNLGTTAERVASFAIDMGDYLTSLSGNVLLDAKILSVSREASGTRLVSHTDLGLQSIVAEQVIVAIPPIEYNLDFLDMDEKESTVVQQFEHSYLYAAIVTVDRLAASYFNWKTDAPYGLLKLPAIYSIRIINGIDHLALVHFGSDTHLEDKEAKTLILNHCLCESQPIPTTSVTRSISEGFYDELNALQGYRRTYWVRAAFETHDSAQIWRFTDKLLQNLLEKQGFRGL